VDAEGQSETCPAHGIVEIIGAAQESDSPRPYLLVRRPTAAAICGIVAVVGPCDLPTGSDKHKIVTLDSPVYVLYAPEDGSPVAGEQWGVKPGDFRLRKGCPGPYAILGNADGITVRVAHRMPPPVLRCRALTCMQPGESVAAEVLNCGGTACETMVAVDSNCTGLLLPGDLFSCVLNYCTCLFDIISGTRQTVYGKADDDIKCGQCGLVSVFHNPDRSCADGQSVCSDEGDVDSTCNIFVGTQCCIKEGERVKAHWNGEFKRWSNETRKANFIEATISPSADPCQPSSVAIIDPKVLDCGTFGETPQALPTTIDLTGQCFTPGSKVILLRVDCAGNQSQSDPCESWRILSVVSSPVTRIEATITGTCSTSGVFTVNNVTAIDGCGAAAPEVTQVSGVGLCLCEGDVIRAERAPCVEGAVPWKVYHSPEHAWAAEATAVSTNCEAGGGDGSGDAECNASAGSTADIQVEDLVAVGCGAVPAGQIAAKNPQGFCVLEGMKLFLTAAYCVEQQCQVWSIRGVSQYIIDVLCDVPVGLAATSGSGAACPTDLKKRKRKICGVPCGDAIETVVLEFTTQNVLTAACLTETAIEDSGGSGGSGEACEGVDLEIATGVCTVTVLCVADCVDECAGS
jgi:hypothetical protein